MSVEDRVQLLIILFSVGSLGFNLYVLRVARRQKPRTSTLAQRSEFTDNSIKWTVWTVRVFVVFQVVVTAIAFLRNYYTLPLLGQDAPAWLTYLIILQALFYSLSSALLGLLLLGNVKGVGRHDKLIAYKLKKKSRRMQTARGRNA